MNKRELIILAAIDACGQQATGINIWHKVKDQTGKEWATGNLYTIMDGLKYCGYICMQLEDSQKPDRGGRRETYAWLTGSGRRVLEAAQEAKPK